MIESERNGSSSKLNLPSWKIRWSMEIAESVPEHAARWERFTAINSSYWGDQKDPLRRSVGENHEGDQFEQSIETIHQEPWRWTTNRPMKKIQEANANARISFTFRPVPNQAPHRQQTHLLDQWTRTFSDHFSLRSSQVCKTKSSLSSN